MWKPFQVRYSLGPLDSGLWAVTFQAFLWVMDRIFGVVFKHDYERSFRPERCLEAEAFEEEFRVMLLKHFKIQESCLKPMTWKDLIGY
ncbi:hypothetical protein Desde_3147 [Desulfitobacterium dehalogenans ATCC 51507]|uniref:Uncharacterized protein n=2 Tax=Desulfitobacterium dehalogenans TaxID=36854 RepID=I4ABV4_DESDJ|nr:hypothetical protein Desde_3147 [Desulfitobacterium dehalogenans ATCC 51507]